MQTYLLIALGSALGGVARYWCGLVSVRLWPIAFPWGTLVINVAGSFIIGLFGALTDPAGRYPAPVNLRLFVMVGICGGYTTFSAFSLQTLTLARDGQTLGAGLNIVLSVVLCLVAVACGSWLGSR